MAFNYNEMTQYQIEQLMEIMPDVGEWTRRCSEDKIYDFGDLIAYQERWEKTQEPDMVEYLRDAAKARHAESIQERKLADRRESYKLQNAERGYEGTESEHKAKLDKAVKFISAHPRVFPDQLTHFDIREHLKLEDYLLLVNILTLTGWNIGMTARLLGISAPHLRTKMSRYGIKVRDFEGERTPCKEAIAIKSRTSIRDV